MLKRSHLDKINEKWFCKVFCSLSIIIFALLLYYCLGGRGVNSGEVTDEHISFQKDSILFNLFLLGVVSVILHLYGKLEKFLISRKRRNILVAVVCVFAVLFGIYWVKTTCTYPQGDQEYVLVYARLFNAGDFSGLKDGEYLGLYPQQLGIVTFFRILRLLFGNEEYLMFQYLTAALLSAVIMSGTKVVRYISRENVKAELFYLLFVVTCFPMYAYTPFIYGDLISLEVGMIAVWAFLACLERMRVWRLVWFGISIGLAVFLRENMIILAIAMGIVVVIKLFCDSERRRHFCVMGAVMILGILLFQGVIKLTYHNVVDPEAEAVPTSTFIVMGLNDDYGYPGWDNGYGLAVFFECDRDADTTTKRAMEDLKSYINLYRNNPSYMVDFFTRKMLTQWNAPMYQCIVMNNRIIGEQGKIVRNIYEQGILFKWINNYMKIFQLVLYASILFLLIVKRREWGAIDKYLLLIAVIGGFFFSLMWEAKTRYVFPYMLMQLPYMAIGVNEVLKFIKAQFAKTKHIV
jgi:Predicted membrane-bound mannosyltransferase